MVDPVGASGNLQNIAQIAKSQKSSSDKEVEAIKPAQAVDEVSLSQEAISLSQAEQAAKDISSSIAHDETSSLSNDVKKLSLLA